LQTPNSDIIRYVKRINKPPGSKRSNATIKLDTPDPVAHTGLLKFQTSSLKNPNLTVGAKVVYAMFISYAWHNDACFPGQDRLATDIGMTQPRIAQLISELQEAGLISIERRGQGKNQTIYTIHYQVKT